MEVVTLSCASPPPLHPLQASNCRPVWQVLDPRKEESTGIVAAVARRGDDCLGLSDEMPEESVAFLDMDLGGSEPDDSYSLPDNYRSSASSGEDSVDNEGEHWQSIKPLQINVKLNVSVQSVHRS